ncbi:MAG TPA: Gfo/Idh/MocA family oxidoreductase [Ignavibacteriaceae bacterium]|nr:Gfo/Idh/MocA family oxidoreductase [Ignavibacteriaceae bacterium]
MKKLNIGVIGTGHLGKFHTKVLSNTENANLVGVFDIDSEKGSAIASEFNTKYFSNLYELIDKVDAVSIAAVTSVHHQIAKECLENNVNVFIEKPITATIEEAEEIVQIAANNKLKLQVGHIERFNPALIAVDKYISNPLFIQSDRLAQFNPRGTDVAVVLDLMIHDIDIILSLINSNVLKIDASGVSVVSDTIDIANARIEFENGAVANVTASRISQKKMRKMRLFQKDAYVSLDFNSGVSEVFRLIDSEETVDSAHINFGEMGIGSKKKRIIYEQPEVIEMNALKYELDLFIKCVLNNEEPAVSGADGLKALRVADEIIEKIEQSLKKVNL